MILWEFHWICNGESMGFYGDCMVLSLDEHWVSMGDSCDKCGINEDS